ncbi:hypothetical protein BV20DRAFT_743232 [Pilatotrama ljubarskyi]|nr:hypothetical protein BV20DRAFT_743232 [Pilatotrama ljubarskyi]
MSTAGKICDFDLGVPLETARPPSCAFSSLALVAKRLGSGVGLQSPYSDRLALLGAGRLAHGAQAHKQGTARSTSHTFHLILSCQIQAAMVGFGIISEPCRDRTTEPAALYPPLLPYMLCAPAEGGTSTARNGYRSVQTPPDASRPSTARTRNYAAYIHEKLSLLANRRLPGMRMVTNSRVCTASHLLATNSTQLSGPPTLPRKDRLCFSRAVRVPGICQPTDHHVGRNLEVCQTSWNTPQYGWSASAR